MKMAWGGGSSKVLRNALKALVESMCTSSMIYTLYFPACGAKRTCSMSTRISSTELLDAASSSWILKERPSLKLLHESHSLHASISAVRFWQLMVLAKMRAQVVLPTPLCPQNKNDCARWLLAMAFLSVFTIALWPTTSLKVDGRYFRADTTKSDMGFLISMFQR